MQNSKYLIAKNNYEAKAEAQREWRPQSLHKPLSPKRIAAQNKKALALLRAEYEYECAD